MAYPNVTINEGGFGSYECAATVALYTRCKFATSASSDGKAKITPAAVGERGNVIAMAPGGTGDQITVRFLNAEGEQFGIASGDIGVGVPVYTAADGQYSAASGGGAVLVGLSTTAGYDGGPFSWIPNIPAA